MRWSVHTALLVASLGVAGSCRAVDVPPEQQQPPPPDLPSPPAPEPAPVLVPDFSRIAESVGPAVVGVISTVEADGKRLRGIGSGMVLSPTGEVLTNEHVVRGAVALLVQLADDRQVPADIVVADHLLDLAVLQLRGELGSLPTVEFRGREQPAKPGEWIMAIGQPFGLGDTVTVGVVSGLGRDYGDLGRPPDLDPAGIWSFIQTDASINIGNSGGPLVDLNGRVLGITTAVRQDGQGLAFAIPSEMALRFVDEVRAHRRLRHTRIGVAARDDYEVEGLPSAVRVTRVERDGPGADAGLEVDDLILKIDGRTIARVSEVAYLTQLAGVGADLELTVRRGSETLSKRIVPGE
jgi:S1-C subfamily serine protease